MDAQQLIDLALNVRLDHWPPHLGVKTDAEKIEYLATALDEAATQIVSNETLSILHEDTALREERDHFERKADNLERKLEQIRNLAK